MSVTETIEGRAERLVRNLNFQFNETHNGRWVPLHAITEEVAAILRAERYRAFYEAEQACKYEIVESPADNEDDCFNAATLDCIHNIRQLRKGEKYERT